jgi:hypothetical protein
LSCCLSSRPGKCLLEVERGSKILEIASEIALLAVGEVARVDGVDILKGEIFDVDVPIDKLTAALGCGDAIFCERRDEGGGGREGGERESGCGGLVGGAPFFSAPLFYGFQRCSFFLESKCKSRNRVSYCLLLFHFSSNQKITAKFELGCQVSNLAAKFELGSRDGRNSWKVYQAKKTWQKISNLAQILPSLNLGTKFEFGTWPELGSDQISRKLYISNSC